MPVAPEIAFAPIKRLARGLRAGEFTAVELAEFFLHRLETLGPTFNAVVTVTKEIAKTQAERADREFAQGHDRGPLHGIPYGAKDLLAAAGAPTTWGAAPLQEQVFDEDATVVARLREAGAVLCAKLAMVEIAGGLGYDQANASFTGPGLNPWNRGFWSGGSSSGSGSAVGAGLVPFAIGSETWGSIMTPASYCGVSGLRPTYGRVSRAGAMALTWSMDRLGPMARTAEDCGIVLQAIAGPDPRDETAVDLPFRWPDPALRVKPPFKIGLLKGCLEHVSPDVRESFEAAVETLAPHADFAAIEFPDLPYSSASSTIILSEMASAFDDFVSSGDVWELTAPEDRWGGYAARWIPAKDYLNSQRVRKLATRELDARLAGIDVLMTPTMASVANPIAMKFDEHFGRWPGGPWPGADNLCGLPAITVPCGFGEHGLPLGLKFIGRAFDDAKVVAFASTYQGLTDWHERTPDVEPKQEPQS